MDTHTEAQFLEFVAVLNSHHPRIKIKHEISSLKLQFLDTEVSFTSTSSDTGTKRLATKVFFKDTDRHAMLYKTSFHPRHTFKGLIKSQLIRIFRICTVRSDVETAAQILFAALKPRGYSARFLRKINDEVTAMYITNTGAFDPTPEQQGPLIPFVITYSTAALEFRSKVSASGVAGVLAALCGSQIRRPPSKSISYWCEFLLLLSIYVFEAPRVFVLASSKGHPQTP